MGLPDWGVGRLLERDDELEALAGLLERARTGLGACVLVEGPAGIGKSSLLEACAVRAGEAGVVSARARGDELAMESSFAAVRELLWQQVRAAGASVLDGSARFAAPVFEDRAGVDADPGRVGAVLHGLYWLVADLSDRGPLVLLVDDAHWLDAASARFLAYLAHRLGSLPVLLVMAMRAREEATPLTGVSGLAACVLRPGGLSEAATGVLVRGELGARADDELCRSCHEATGGNPFYLRELTIALRAEDARPTVEVARGVRSLGAGVIGRSVVVRLGRLGGDCERLAEALAVLGPGSPLRHAAGLADLARDQATVAADRLRGADLLSERRALSFMHPIVHEAIAAELAASRRAALHAKAAAMLAGEDAPVDRVAAHLLSAEPYGEVWVVDALRAAARNALAQGAPEAAVSYLRRALAEPPPPDLRLQVLSELGGAEAMLPITPDFAALREALDLASDPGQRAQIALELAWGLTGVARGADVARVLESALDDAADLDPGLVERMEGLMLGAGASDLTATRRVLARVGRHFERAARGEVLDPTMLAALGQTGAMIGLPAIEVTQLCRLALEDERLLDVPPAYQAATYALSWTDQLEEAANAQDVGIAEAQRRGSAPMFMQLSTVRAATAWRAGELEAAEDHAQRAYELARELGVDHFAVMVTIRVLLERGRVEDASQLAESLTLSEPDLALWQGVVVLAERGAVRIERGDLERGVADLLDADRRMTGAGCHLSVLTDWVATAALTLARLGRDQEATELAMRELADAVAFGAPRRHGIAVSVCGRLDPGPRGLAGLREAVGLLERSPARLELARALVNLGTGMRERDQRKAAREPLARGMDLAYRCGGVLLAERARAELLASGARPRRAALLGPDALTPAELRTARMAARGPSNREIAQALFVSAKTVETQLSQAYAKLGIRTRDELPAALMAVSPR